MSSSKSPGGPPESLTAAAAAATAAAAAAAATRCRARAHRRCAGSRAAALAAEHLHFVGHDLRGVAVLAFLVLPLARAQLAFDVNLRALAQVFGGDLGQAAEHRDLVPLRAVLLLAGLLVFPRLRGRESQVRDGTAARHVARLGVFAEIADENDLVDASCHASSCFCGPLGALATDAAALWPGRVIVRPALPFGSSQSRESA